MVEATVANEHSSLEMTSKSSNDATVITDTSAPTLAASFQYTFNLLFYIPGLSVGALGIVTNGLVVYALYASKQHKKQALIFNQNVIDLFASFWLFVTYAVHLSDVYLTGALGYWLCTLVVSETVLYIGFTASKINLVAITIERYLKVVHSVWSKKRLRKWMTQAAMAFAWIGAAVYSVTLTFTTTAVFEGRRRCFVLTVWPSDAAHTGWAIYAFASFFAIPLLIFAFCYARILIVLRRQARVMAGHGGSTTNTSHRRIQANVIKTMMLVTLFYAASNLALEIYYLLRSVAVPVLDSWYYAAVYITFVYICANPFVYAVNFKPVKNVLLGLMPCKAFHPVPENIEITGIRGTTGRF